MSNFVHLLKYYLKRLVRTDGGNRSILIYKLSESEFDLFSIEKSGLKPAHEIIAALLNGNSNIALCPSNDARSYELNKLSTELKNVWRKNKKTIDEFGNSNLVLGWPWLRGKWKNGSLVNCPLLLWEINLLEHNNTWNISIEDGYRCTFNQSFLLAYEYHNEIELPTSIWDKNFLNQSIDITEFKTMLYQLIGNSKMVLNFNQELFQNKIEPFPNYSKNELEKNHPLGTLKLFSNAVIGQFDNGWNNIGKGIQKLINCNKYDSIEDFFESKFINPSITHKETNLINLLPLDAWQEEAILKVKQGNSLLVQGPPGSGKSQLITNLMVDFIASGKKVWVVSQKKAALEVIFYRLQQLKIDSFAALFTHLQHDKKNIFDSLLFQIESCKNYKLLNSTYEIYEIEKKYKQCCRQIDLHLQTLEKYKKALFDNQQFGISAKELYLTIPKLDNKINVQTKLPLLHRQQLISNKQSYLEYWRLLKKIEPNQAIWDNRKFIPKLSSLSLDEITHKIDQLEDLSLLSKQLMEQYNIPIGALKEFNQSMQILGNHENASFLLQQNESLNFLKWIIEKHSDSNSIPPLFDIIRNNHTFYPELFTENKEAQVEKVKNECQQVLSNFESYFKKYYSQVFSSSYQTIKKILALASQPVNKETVTWLYQVCVSKLKHIQASNAAIEQLYRYPSITNDTKIVAYQKCYLQLAEIIERLKAASKELSISWVQKLEHPIELETIILHARNNLKSIQESGYYLGSMHIEALLNNELSSKTLIQAYVSDYAHIRQLEQLEKKLSTDEIKMLNAFYSISPNENEEKIYAALFQYHPSNWLKAIEIQHPILNELSAQKIEEIENELQNLNSEKLSISHQIVLSKLREQVFQGLQYNRLNHQISYRDLKHQVSKKKNQWSVRQLMEKFEEEIYKLIPCWLLSPEAADIAMENCAEIDLLIFDEASQCMPEHAIAAIAKAKQVVIAGDSKQLLPFTLYQNKWVTNDTENDIIDIEIDSLLLLGERYLPTFMLKGHYRSQHEALINFSNIHFYHRKLEFLPHYHHFRNPTNILNYHLINGQYQKGINKEECRAIVQYLIEKKVEYHQKTIGIICFSYAQAQYLLNEIEKAHDYLMKILENIKVKNIENVQGDEFDIVLISLGYAPEKGNQKVMAKLGSISMMDGENRLNVAITRAKEKIELFASFTPEQLNVDDTSYEGSKLLKAYLQYVYHFNQKIDKELIDFNNSKSTFTSLLEIKIATDKSNQYYQHHFADALLEESNKNFALVFTDDMKYANSSHIKEYHLYKKIEAKNKNWNSKSYWSIDWYNHEMRKNSQE